MARRKTTPPPQNIPESLSEQEKRVKEFDPALYYALDKIAQEHSFWLARDVIFKYGVELPIPHTNQRKLIEYHAGGKHVICLAGRRGGKTTASAMLAVGSMLSGKHVVYAAPTEVQTRAFWGACSKFLGRSLKSSMVRKLSAFGRDVSEKERGLFERIYFNPTTHVIAQRPEDVDVGIIYCMTAFNPDVLRSHDADLLILDEAQMLSPATLTEVGFPMLLDRDGHVVVIFTYPGPETPRNLRPGQQYFFLQLYRRVKAFHDSGVDGVRDIQDADAESGIIGREDTPAILEQDDFSDWAPPLHFTSYDNPYISADAIEKMKRATPPDVFAREVLGQDAESANTRRALWSEAMIDAGRVMAIPPDEHIERYVIGVDPAVKGGTTGMVVIAVARKRDRKASNYYVVEDASEKTSVEVWSAKIAALYQKYAQQASTTVVVEENQGGDMVRALVRTYDPTVRIGMARATTSKAHRAAPIVLMYARGIVHHVGKLQALEEEMTTWAPGMVGHAREYSPNRVDALVWALTYATQFSTGYTGIKIFRLGDGGMSVHSESVQ